MNCQEFKQWLSRQNSTDDSALQQVRNHVQTCRTCEALHQADMKLDNMLKEGMQAIEPPSDLVNRARSRIEFEPRSQFFRFLNSPWKIALPVLSMAALVLMMVLNPFSAHLQTVDEMVKHSISNHMDTSMQMAFKAGEVVDIDQWFTHRLGYEVQLPDLKRLNLKLLGGRRCAFGKIDTALLFCNSKGKRASLFMINQKDVGISFNKERKYIVEQGGYKVKIWKDAGLVYALVI